jgi:hypothetical protein
VESTADRDQNQDFPVRSDKEGVVRQGPSSDGDEAGSYPVGDFVFPFWDHDRLEEIRVHHLLLCKKK